MNVFFRVWFALLVPLCTIFIFSRVSAQTNERYVDSLKIRLAKASSDSDKVNILIELSSQSGCEDTPDRLNYANKAKELAEKARWTIGVIKANTTLGNIYYACMNDFAKAYKYYLQSDSLARKINDNASEIIALRDIAFYFKTTGQFRQSIDHYWQVLSLHPTYDDEMGIWGNLGVEYNSIGDYNKALDCYYNSLRVLDTLQKLKKTSDVQDTIQLACLLLNIGDIYLEMVKPDQAFLNYDSARQIGIMINHGGLQITGLMGMGKVFQTKKNYGRSIEYYLEALKESTDQNNFKDRVKILYELANSYLGNGDLIKAMDFAQASLKLAEEKANNVELPRAFTAIGNVYLTQKEYANAVNYFQKTLDIARSTGALDDQRNAWFGLDSAYAQLHQPDKARMAYKSYVAIRDSLYNIATANEFTRQEVTYNYRIRQQADELNYAKKIARQQALTYCGFAGVALVLLLVFFVYRNYNTQKKYNELLSHEKERHLAHIEAQDTVLTDIAHIQSHQVRGPVATILGLVQIFNYNDLSDPVNKEVMDGIGITTEKLDVVIKEVILMENNLKRDQTTADNKAGIIPDHSG